ncbi:MAG: diaminopimelate epimerase [Spirochaetota bacterium]
MDFYKYHALGNDYIVLDPQKININLSKDNIKLICHRNFGIGSDGILYGPIFNDTKINLRIFNPDGSEAEKSGNGLRIFSKYLIDAGYISNKVFLVSTIGGEVKVEILSYEPVLIKIDMGTVTFKSNEIPVSGKVREIINEPLLVKGNSYNITCLSIGNPHCVILLNDISEEKAREIGPLIENNVIFPNRINVQLLKIIDRQNINIEIWERGAGYTLASGSSSCAAACAANKLGLVDKKIRVNMQGGYLEIEIDESGHIQMIGHVSAVMEGNFSREMRTKLM